MSLITLAEAKLACDVTNTARDGRMQNIIDGVEQWATGYLGRTFTRGTTVIDYLNGGGHALWPRTRPVISVTEVYDTEASTAENADNYDLVDDGIFTADNSRWPDAPPNRWRVTYVGGDNGLPAGVKSTLLSLIARIWANPESLSEQSAGGYRSGFQGLVDSDIMFLLEPFRAGGGAWG